MRSLPVLLLALGLSACSVPEARLRAGLIGAGLPEPLAACMADRMVDRLSLMQLRRLADLERAGRAHDLPEFLHRVRSLRDPEIWTVTSTSVAVCELRG
jgi:hypothetical protein